MVNSSTEPNRYVNKNVALSVMTTLFFMWGFLTCLNDILVPHLKELFKLNYAEAMLIQFTFFGAYFLMAYPSGFLLQKIGFKKGIITALIIAGFGSLLFYPAAGTRSYPLFLAALFILASGITLLQVSANPYVSILGKPETASSRLNLAQAVNSLGHTLAPLFGAVMILSVPTLTIDKVSALNPIELEAYFSTKASAVQVPYIGLAAALIILAVIISLFKLPPVSADSEDIGSGSETIDGQYSSPWKYRHLKYGAIGIFLYVGAEVSIGSFLVNFFSEKTIAGFDAETAGKYVSFYWGAAMVGRFIGSALLQKIKPDRSLGFVAIGASFLVLMTIINSGHFAMWAIISVGLFNSIMFPNIFTLSIRKLGKHTPKASGILIMMIVGGAVIPLLQGILADNIGIHTAFVLPMLCYLYVAYYGFIGSKI